MTSQVAKVCLLFIPTVGLSRKRGLDSLETSHSIFSQHGGPRLPSTRREGKTGDLQSGSLVLLVSVLYSTDHSSLSRIVKAAVILLNVLNVNVKKTLLDIQYSKVGRQTLPDQLVALLLLEGATVQKERESYVLSNM